jgi:putative addiction module killer protein
VFQIQTTDTFADWLRHLRDSKAKARILARLDSVTLGNLGDTKMVGEGVRELRVHVGPGYRIYFAQTGRIVILLLCGGDKSSQKRDIERAKRLLRECREV